MTGVMEILDRNWYDSFKNLASISNVTSIAVLPTVAFTKKSRVLFVILEFSIIPLQLNFSASGPRKLIVLI